VKVIVYDATATDTFIGSSWALVADYFGLMRLCDIVVEASSWEQAFTKMAALKRVDEVQVWCHGWAGSATIGKGARADRFSAASFEEGHEHFRSLRAFSNRLQPDALFWLRTCASFAGSPGHRFAKTLATFLRCRVAGSTHNIGFPWHSGIRSLRPGFAPSWPLTEGIAEGTPDQPKKFLPSGSVRPNTLFFMKTRIPEAW
jgi:hypothetical protein